MKTGYIYGLYCPIEKRIVYIGQTTKKLKERLIGHISESRTRLYYGRFLSKKNEWICKLIELGIENEIKIISLLECSENELNKYEIKLIKEYSEINEIFNSTSGGEMNTVGLPFTVERKKEMSDIKKKFWTDEQRKRLSNIMKEYYKTHYHPWRDEKRKHTKNSKDKISKSRTGKCKGEEHFNFGKHLSEETRKRISEKVGGENHPNFGKHLSVETKNKIGEKNIGENNGMYGVHLIKTPEQIEKQRINMINSKKFQESRKSKEYKEKISNIFSVPLYLLDINFDIIMEFKNSKECAEYLKCKPANVQHAVKDLRKVCKKQYWCVRKENFEESINKIKEKL
jgi:hypothetical protein